MPRAHPVLATTHQQHSSDSPAQPTLLRSTLVTEYNGEIAHGVPREVANRADHASEGAIGVNNNNYSRNEGQNVG